MPTPSSHDATGSHSFGATCPDDQNPRSPSSWRPPSPYRASMGEGPSPDALTGDEDMDSRSTTLSPRPESSRDGPAPTPPAATRHQEPDDAHKQGDADEEMAGAAPPRAERRTSPDGEIVVEEAVAGHLRPARRRRPGNSASDIAFRLSADGERLDDSAALAGMEWGDDGNRPMGYHFSNLRIIPITPSSFLRPGSKFTGTQQSERQVYDVQVEIKHVDLRESFLCGYLRIQGLTEDHPTLTTYFEGEIIGAKYGFMTKHESWGANDRIDLSHWGKFGAFRPFLKQAKKGNFAIKDYAQKENIFMRWKEHFLVPDHRVRTINGASFEGFYYICFNQVEGRVSGIYFHSKSEKFQQLELKHVEDRGCFGAMEFR